MVFSRAAHMSEGLTQNTPKIPAHSDQRGRRLKLLHQQEASWGPPPTQMSRRKTSHATIQRTRLGSDSRHPGHLRWGCQARQHWHQEVPSPSSGGGSTAHRDRMSSTRKLGYTLRDRSTRSGSPPSIDAARTRVHYKTGTLSSGQIALSPDRTRRPLRKIIITIIVIS